jgi:hypothetical protein
MTYNDLIGTIGVGLLLVAYFLNNTRLIPTNGKTYYIINMAGASLACFASFLINYPPFIILEGTWCLVSIYGLMKAMKIKIT